MLLYDVDLPCRKNIETWLEGVKLLLEEDLLFLFNYFSFQICCIDYHRGSFLYLKFMPIEYIGNHSQMSFIFQIIKEVRGGGQGYQSRNVSRTFDFLEI